MGSLVPYVTYNLYFACTAGQEGQRSPWAKVAMGTTSGCSPVLFAVLTHLKAELSRISLCQARILLLYFLTLLCSFTSLCFPSTHRRLHEEALGLLLACWHIHVYAWTQTHSTTSPPKHTYTHTPTLRMFSHRTFLCKSLLNKANDQFLEVLTFFESNKCLTLILSLPFHPI